MLADEKKEKRNEKYFLLSIIHPIISMMSYLPFMRHNFKLLKGDRVVEKFIINGLVFFFLIILDVLDNAM